jgi:hypothetical protein
MPSHPFRFATLAPALLGCMLALPMSAQAAEKMFNIDMTSSQKVDRLLVRHKNDKDMAVRIDVYRENAPGTAAKLINTRPMMPKDSITLAPGFKYTVHFSAYSQEGFDARFSIIEGADSANFWVACDLPTFAPDPLITPDNGTKAQPRPKNVDYVGDGNLPFNTVKYSNKAPR